VRCLVCVLQLDDDQYWDVNPASSTFETFVTTKGKAAGTGSDGWAPQDKFNPACQSNACQRLMVHDPDASCLPAFLLYSSQFIAAIAVMLFGIVAVMFSRSVKAQHKHDEDMERMNPVIKMFLTTFVVLVMMMWAAASIAGASMKISNMVFALAFVALVVMGIIVGGTIGKKALSQEIHKIPMVEKIEKMGGNLHMQGIFVLFGGWVFLPCVFFISFWNRFNRKFFRWYAPPPPLPGSRSLARSLALSAAFASAVICPLLRCDHLHPCACRVCWLDVAQTLAGCT
jgi:hypothetical protein